MKTISIDSLNHVLVDSERTSKKRLTVKEAQLLRAIMRRGGVATKEYLLQDLYNGIDEPELKIIDVFICKLRGKLGAHKDAILTTWGRGYVRGEDYELEDSLVSVAISRKTQELLDQVALEDDKRPEELAGVLLHNALVAHRKALWHGERR